MHDPETIHDDAPATNTSGNRPFEDVLNARMGRRMVLGGTLAGAVGALFVSPASAASRAITAGSKSHDRDRDRDRKRDRDRGHGRGKREPLVGFEPIPLNFSDQPVVSSDYTIEVLVQRVRDQQPRVRSRPTDERRTGGGFPGRPWL